MKNKGILSLLALLFSNTVQMMNVQRSQEDYSEESDEQQTDLSYYSDSGNPNLMLDDRSLQLKQSNKNKQLCYEDCYPTWNPENRRCTGGYGHEVTLERCTILPDDIGEAFIYRCCVLADPLLKPPRGYDGSDACKKFGQGNSTTDTAIMNANMCYKINDVDKSGNPVTQSACKYPSKLHRLCDQGKIDCESKWSANRHMYCCYGDEEMPRIWSPSVTGRKCYKVDHCTCYELEFDNYCRFTTGKNIWATKTCY